jgi:hypothetical protein
VVDGGEDGRVVALDAAGGEQVLCGFDGSHRSQGAVDGGFESGVQVGFRDAGSRNARYA